MRPPHEVLGIPENATGAQIEEAYNRKKLYLNPANFEEGSEEQELTKTYLLELEEAREKLLSLTPQPATPAGPANLPNRDETADPVYDERDFPIVNPAGETRKKMLISIASMIVMAFLVMLCVSLSFAYTSGLKAEIADLNARIDLLEAEKDNLKDKLEAQKGKTDDLGRTIDNLSNTVLEHGSRITGLEYQR